MGATDDDPETGLSERRLLQLQLQLRKLYYSFTDAMMLSTWNREIQYLQEKHRNGPTGKVQLAWMEQYTKFASLARRV